MSIFAYKGIDKSGKDIKGNINADNLLQAKQKMRAQGVMLTQIHEQTTGHKDDSSGKVFGVSLGGNINIQDLSLMTRQFATLVKAKIQIVDALSALIDQVDNEKMRVILAEVRKKVNEGSSLAKALSEYPKAFNSIYVNMVEAGEASGTLDIVLLRLAEFTESQNKLKNRIQSALYYPVAMASFGFILINIIFIKVIPQIAKIFTSTKLTLPLQTRVCLAISDFLRNQWYVALGAIFLIFILFKRYINSPSGKRRWHTLQLKLPVIGPLVKMINVGRFCSTLATLLNSGVPILASMSIVRNLVPNILMKEALEESRVAISEGSSMTGPLLKNGNFPPMVTHMIRLGEKSGELEPMLQIVAENYQDQVDSKLSGLTSILEPIMMVVLGLVVAFVVFSVIVPLMEINRVR